MQLSVKTDTDAYLIAPQPELARLTRAVVGRDHTGAETTINVVEERPLTIFLNAQEIVTAMTIGDYPEYLALGFLRNQGMLRDGEEITGVDYDEELEVVVVRTARKTDYEDRAGGRDLACHACAYLMALCAKRADQPHPQPVP